MKYEAWQWRVIQERDELHDRVCKLCNFMQTSFAETVPVEHLKLLQAQYMHMEKLLAILNARVELFDK